MKRTVEGASLLLLDGDVEVILAPDDDLSALARRRRRLQHDARRLRVLRLQLLRLAGQRGRQATQATVDISVRCGEEGNTDDYFIAIIRAQ